MFYDHEILTSRKYGVATVWLMATLGAKSHAKKVSRKAIVDVDVKRVCNTIMQPVAPLALRLQSSLLYGLSQVYSQQCGYVLADAQTTQNTIRSFLKYTKHNDLDPSAGKARLDQLVLMDDPAFMLDMALPDLYFDNANLDSELSQSQLSTLLSSVSRSRSGSQSSQISSVVGLIIPTSDGVEFPFALDPYLHGSSAQKTPMGLRLPFDGEEQLLQDVDFEFGADGDFVNMDDVELERRRTGSLVPQLGRLETDSAASARVRLEHEEGVRGAHDNLIEEDRDFFINFDDDDIIVLPSGEAFPSITAAAAARRGQLDSSVSPIISSVSSVAAPQRRKRRALKYISVDYEIELRSSDLKAWQDEYTAKMSVPTKGQKQQQSLLAKKMAYSLVWGNGIGNIGSLIKDSGDMPHPLSMFTGDSLRALITGEETTLALRVTRKRSLEGQDEADGRRVRPRLDQDEEIARGYYEDDGILANFDDSTNLEIGRVAHSALDDHPSSAAMPWNVSASIHSYRQGQVVPSSSNPGRMGSSLGGPNRRLTSLSPLLGRGKSEILSIDLNLGAGGADDYQLPTLGAGFDDTDLVLNRGEAHRRVSESQGEEFERFGPAAAADTQTAQSSQWVNAVLAKEAMNFFAFVKNSVREKTLGEDPADEEEDISDVVTFEELCKPGKESAIVAAQAFHHVLTLVTKGLLVVQQDEQWGEIWMGVRGGVGNVDEDIDDSDDMGGDFGGVAEVDVAA